MTMPARATTNAGHKKVRCPKCTALFKEPAKHTFECPICSCRLSATGTIVLTEVIPNQMKAEESGQGRAANGNNERSSRTQSLVEFVKKEGCEGDKGASHVQTYRIQEKQPVTDTEKECPRVSEKDNENGQPSVDGNIEDPHCAHDRARGNNTTGELSSDNAVEEDPSLLREEDNLIAAEDEGTEGQDCVERDGARGRRLQSQLFQTTRCEFSFKYSLGVASPLESDGQLRHQKGSPGSKIVSSETIIPDNEASDMPLHTPLRVRISNPHEESSDQSENGRYSFNSETGSSDGSDSDFGFPAPWAEGLGDIVLPASFGQNEIFHPNSDCFVSAAPHQLELQDVDDPIDHLQESGEHFEGAKAELPKQVQDDGGIMSDAGRESTISELYPGNHSQSNDHPLEVMDLANRVSSVMLNHNLDEVDSKEMLLMKGGTGKLRMSGSKQGSGNAEEQETVLNQDIIVHQVGVGKVESNANIWREVSEPMDVLVSPDGGCVAKLSGQCNVKQERINADNVKSRKKDVVSIPSCNTADFAPSTILFNQVDIKPKVSASNLNHIDCSDEEQSFPSTGHLGLGFQMAGSPEISRDVLDQSHIYHNMMSSGTIGHDLSGTREGQLADTLLSNVSRIEQSYNALELSFDREGQLAGSLLSNMNKMEHLFNGPDARHGNVSDHQLLSHMENAELELDLYSQPVEVLGNESSSGKRSYSDPWEEKKSSVMALSDGTLANTSKGRMYYERNDPLKSSQDKFHEKSEAQLVRSDNGEELFRTGSDMNLRGHAALQGNLFQPEHVAWKGHITAVENQGHHPDIHEVDGNLGSYSQYSVNNTPGFSLANSQRYVLTNNHLGYGVSGANQMYSYPVPSQSLVLPAAFQNHALTHCAYHAMSPACMICSHHQHPHMQPPHIPHCAVCYDHSGSIAYKSGHSEHWNCYQAHHGSVPTYASSLVEGSQACSFSTHLAQKLDFSKAEFRSQASSARMVSQYPPLPRDSAAPYVTCKGCSRVLQVPSDLPPSDGIMQKLRCGACRKIMKFSVNCYNHQRHVVSSIPPELDSMGGATNMLPPVQYSTRSGQLPVVTATESMKPSYDHDRLKVNPVSHGSREPSLHKVWPQADNTTPTEFASRISDKNSQGGEFFRGQPRNHAADASLSPLENAASLTDVMSPRREDLRSTDSFGFGRSKVSPAASLHLTVDEKEEGLDFGAPRISDGDSLDHSESRMRSPENIQAFHQRNPAEVSQGGVPLGGHPPEQVPGSPLLVLLNQESTRFRLTLDPRVPLDESRPATCSPALGSPGYDNPIQNRPRGKERDNSQSNGTSAQHFVSKGPKYIAGLLRRSLKDFGRGGP